MSDIKLFESKRIRSIWDDKTQRWLFAIVDVVAALTESQNPQVYWRVLKKRLLDEGNQTVTNRNALKMTAPDGKQRLADVADTEQLLRLIQSIPSPKAEPFKRWLAQVGYERLEEIENPELAATRMRALYQAKGYSDEWIENPVRGIAIRENFLNVISGAEPPVKSAATRCQTIFLTSGKWSVCAPGASARSMLDADTSHLKGPGI